VQVSAEPVPEGAIDDIADRLLGMRLSPRKTGGFTVASVRPGTEAARMPDKVSDKVKRERTQKILALARESAQDFRQRFLGKKMTVLWEGQSDSIWSGLTDNYVRVYTGSERDLTNQLLPAKLVEVSRDGVWGSI
jgi:threonylcarbamoyladenosine tRNA methylthiotransferase MtaB